MSGVGGDIIFLTSPDENQPGQSHHSVTPISCGDLTFARIFDFYRGPLLNIQAFDAIVVEMTEYMSTRNLVSKIRRHLDQQVFIKPVFVLSSSQDDISVLSHMIDGSIQHIDTINTLVGKTNLINRRLAKYDFSKNLAYEDQRIFGFLAYIASRDIKEIAPFIDRLGIYYPILSDTSEAFPEQRHFLNVLSKIEGQGYLHGNFVQSTYLCSDCLGDHLLYREVCPSCKSAHLHAEEIIHHFRCAHVAPLSKFRASNQISAALECPKCQYELKHIGVDYDKPATMHYCNNCQSEFQQYAMMAKCTCCDRDQDVEHLIKKEIKKYALTDKSLNVLKTGLLYPPKENDQALEDTLPWHLFIKTIDFEQSQLSGDLNHLVMIYFHDLPGILKQVGEENKLKLFNEIIQIVKSTQQSFDFRGAKLPRLYFTLMKTKQQEAEIISQRIIFLINHLLQDNLRIKRSAVSAKVLSFDVELIETVLHEKQKVN